jgi:peptidoglycan/xylan/chitin deacetylase (PgdA/CDA1 family)
MPDMTSWAAGSPSDDPATYVPYYSASTGKTTGGTVYPELLISARLLRDDFGIQVRGWRSGHLARPRDLPRLLQATGYWYESNEAAGSNGGALPYLRLASYSSSGPETTVLEVPMSISDNDMSTRTAAQSAALWIDVTYKNAANGAPTVILVHPTRPETKIPAYRPFLDRVATDPNLWVGSMDDWYSWYRAQGIRSQQ